MYNTINTPISRDVLARLLDNASNARVGLIGDLCLDMYWLADMRLSELSRETPHYPLPVVEERYAPGGAGNAACNIAALKPGKLMVLGVVGTDWRGDLLMQALKGNGVDCTGVVRDPQRVTNAYIKPLRKGISDVVYEDPRLDFCARTQLLPETEQKLIAALEKAAEELDVLCVSDQMACGCITPAVRAKICELGKKGMTVIVDSRDRAAEYRHVTLKPNEVEAARAFGDGTEAGIDALSELASKVFRHSGRTALMTLGEHGCFVADEGGVVRCPACSVEPPIDFCGAGDTFLSGFATMVAAGADAVQAAQIANLCSAVTIRKIGMTGTATRAEVLAAWDRYSAQL